MNTAAFSMMDECIAGKHSYCAAFIPEAGFRLRSLCMGQSDVRAGGWCGTMLRSTASNRAAPIGWSGRIGLPSSVIWPTARLCTRLAQHRPRCEASADFEERSGRTLRTGTQAGAEETQEALPASAPWGRSCTSRLDSVAIRSGQRYVICIICVILFLIGRILF